MRRTPLTGEALAERFAGLDDFLTGHQHLWRPKPFTMPVLPWEAEHPRLAAWLRSRTLDDAEAAHHGGCPPGAPTPFAALAEQAERLSKVGDFPAQQDRPVPTTLAVDVPGHKWQQILAFAECLPSTKAPRHWLDWCAGKGHLGRALACDGTPLTSLEWDAALVEASQRLSDRHGLNATHRCQDVLAEDAAQQLQAHHVPVALHACGDLHVRLLRLASEAGCRQLAVVPCCYNRIASTNYSPLSRSARNSALQLSRDDLRLPLTETVTAGARLRRQRDRSMAWRLGFDLLQRQLRERDDYLNVPSLPVSWLGKPFADYCRDLAALKELPAPAERDWEALEQSGWRRLAEVRNLELVRGLFRRPLELWLLLDHALYLRENGYHVQLGRFCDQRLTPRNLLLFAER